MENRLGIVVGVVPDRHAGRVRLEGDTLEELVTALAGNLLGRAAVSFDFGRDVHVFNVRRQRELSREVLDEFRVGIRLAATQAVVQMGNVQLPAQLTLFGELAHGVQQQDGVRAAGHADDPPRLRREQCLALEPAAQPFEERIPVHTMLHLRATARVVGLTRRELIIIGERVSYWGEEKRRLSTARHHCSVDHEHKGGPSLQPWGTRMGLRFASPTAEAMGHPSSTAARGAGRYIAVEGKHASQRRTVVERR